MLLGGTGAMGVYLAPELSTRGFKIDITTRAERMSNDKNIQYIAGDAHDATFLNKTLDEGKYDVIVDFMVYSTDEFRSRSELLLKSCQQYIFLSSYRVFADAEIVTEETPRLLDITTDEEYLHTDDYALTKARQEDILRASSNTGWTIVRPAITYSRERFQLGTLESDTIVWRALQGLPTVLPHDMLSKSTTMTWAGDVARLIAGLVLNKKAYGEDFNVSTSEHHTWAEVAEMYHKIIGLNIKPVGTDEYTEALGGGHSKYQVNYDRMFNRVMDNAKVLRVTGEKQESFTSLEDGLRRELAQFVKRPHYVWIDYAKQARIDKLTGTRINMTRLKTQDRELYESINPSLLTRVKRKLRLRTRLRGILRQVRNIRPRTRVKRFARRVGNWLERQRMKRAEGAIVTLTGYYNYGNMIQRYALQEFLRQKGHKFVSYAREPLVLEGDEARRYRFTSEFVARNIWRKPFDPNDNYSTYIVGSDQVWRNWGYADITSELGYFFFDFARDTQAKRIAYAASFGKDSLEGAWISSEFVDYAAPLVEKFNAISVRETSGVRLMEDVWHAKAEHVLDPTMLLTREDYSRLITNSPQPLPDAKQIFTYILTISKENDKIVEGISHATGGEVSGIDLEHFDILPPVEQWLQGFRDAELVVTDSFHGTVFSIINNTPFVVIENANGGVARMTSLLEEFGIEGRLITEGSGDTFDFSKLQPIDWEEVNKRLENLRARSGDWLLKALEKKPKSRST